MRLNSTRFLSLIELKYLRKLYKDYTKESVSFLENDPTLLSNSTLDLGRTHY